MTTRFDVERAVLASELPKSARLVMLVLLTHTDNDTAETPARYSPSLTCLANESALGRNTVQEVLRELEAQGWVKRRRPPVEESRKGARTRYQLAVPVGRPPTQVDTEVGRPPTQARSTTDPGVGHPQGKGRSVTDPRITSALVTQVTQRARVDEEIAAVIEALRDRTGKTIDQHHAQLVIKQLLDGRNGIRDRIAYLTGAIARDADPDRFLPTPSPPPYRRED